MHVNTDLCCCMATDSNMVLAGNTAGTSAWLQVAEQAPHIRLLLITLASRLQLPLFTAPFCPSSFPAHPNGAQTSGCPPPHLCHLVVAGRSHQLSLFLTSNYYLQLGHLPAVSGLMVRMYLSGEIRAFPSLTGASVCTLFAVYGMARVGGVLAVIPSLTLASIKCPAR